MAIHHEAPPDARPRLITASTVGRSTLVGVAIAAVAGTFAYLGGWLTPNALTPARFTNAFEEVNGVYCGFRRNHAKGVGVSGFFESNGNGVRLSKAAVFQPGRVPVLGVFSLGGGNPFAPDTVSAPRGLGLQFALPDGELWRTAMLHLPVFPFRTPEDFYEQLFAFSPDPSTGQPDPAKVQAFLAHHPESAEAHQEPAGPVRVRRRHVPQPECVSLHQRGQRVHTGALDPDARAALEDHSFPGQGLLVRRADRTDAPPAVAVVSHRHRRPARRPDQRRHHCLASGTGTGQRRHADARPSRE